MREQLITAGFYLLIIGGAIWQYMSFCNFQEGLSRLTQEHIKKLWEGEEA